MWICWLWQSKVWGSRSQSGVPSFFTQEAWEVVHRGRIQTLRKWWAFVPGEILSIRVGWVFFERLDAALTVYWHLQSLWTGNCIQQSPQVTDLCGTFAGNWGGRPHAGYLKSTGKTPPAGHGRPVFVVDCNANLKFEKASKECDAVIDQIVKFLLGSQA